MFTLRVKHNPKIHPQTEMKNRRYMTVRNPAPELMVLYSMAQRIVNASTDRGTCYSYPRVKIYVAEFNLQEGLMTIVTIDYESKETMSSTMFHFKKPLRFKKQLMFTFKILKSLLRVNMEYELILVSSNFTYNYISEKSASEHVFVTLESLVTSAFVKCMCQSK